MAMTPVSGRPAPPDLREDARVGKPIENGRISNNMTDPWPAVIGTLGGVLITAATALLTQALQARRVRDGEMRTARREVYAKYLSAANAYCRVWLTSRGRSARVLASWRMSVRSAQRCSRLN